jgi:serine/threonine protein kinase
MMKVDSTKMQRFSIGDTVAHRYVLKREVARGGGGIVFEAVQRFTTRRVALKLLTHEQGADSPEGLRLLREARALTVARHPNRVELLDAGICSTGGPCIGKYAILIMRN